ncbi:FMN-binding protein [Paenibacillus sp. FSL R10-2782]|uniref:FMN-binding protein n=1 Tax=Paenibacillus sp. FSL R10-2782 TaxID=2954661 RepID=UPI0031594382
MAQMNKKWVVLCSTAITAVYAAGYFTTETEAAMPPLPHHTQVSIPTNDISKNNNPSNVKSTYTNKHHISPKSLYKDGTYTGMGNNRRGSIEVSVTIKNDKITDVEVSHFAMHYSESDIAGLPSEVVQNQSEQVRNVSGATYSTRAFQDAVQNALSSAQNV